MRILAIECATPACSVALFESEPAQQERSEAGPNSDLAIGELVAGAFEEIGRGHAERLVPLIAALPGKGRAGRIAVSLGPGSFTGVRIGLAAARALGLAWSAEVLGYPTLGLVAAMARARAPWEADGAGPVSVAMSGGHGEWFVQDFLGNGLASNDPASLAPEQAIRAARQALVAGSEAAALVALRGTGRAMALLPDARCLPLLPAALFTTSLAPIYGRPPDARIGAAAAAAPAGPPAAGAVAPP